MNYFTTEEARSIINHSPATLFTRFDNNPNRDAAAECMRMCTSEHRPTLFNAALYGFLLGRATGIREERERRRKQLEGSR